MENSDENIKFGICPECKVREGDSSEKKLYQCPYCKEWFCEKHIEPKLVITWNAMQRTEDPFLKEKLYEEWRKEGGHPCSVWTMQYFENLEIEEREKREKFLRALDKENIKITLYDKSSEVPKKRISSNKSLDKIEKVEKSNLYSKSTEVPEEKTSSRDVAVIAILLLSLFLILLNYSAAARPIMISLFILLVLAAIIAIFR
ncbi:MAG: hypothetical protein RXO36_03800 [Candidatus Nanopusillus acidilobi]